uniref:Ig-like domain-containing protein n=1 Tax=Flavisolibacter nicotianae TaxID=2364882 RepID=UPI0013C4DE2D
MNTNSTLLPRQIAAVCMDVGNAISKLTKRYAVGKFIPFLILGIVFAGTAKSQVPCPTGNCNSQDIKIENNAVELVNAVDHSALPTTCSGGSYNVSMKLTFNVTSQTRYGFIIVADVYIGGSKSGRIAKCFSGEFAQGLHTSYVDTYLDGTTIVWNCGQSIQLRNVYTAWDNQDPTRSPFPPDICTRLQADGTITASDCSSIDPKCKFYGNGEEIVIVTPLSANFAYTASCPSGKSAQTVAFDALDATSGTTGGTTPYPSGAFSWTITNSSNVQVGTMSGATPSFDFSQAGAGPGTYTVTLTVTDDNPTATSSKQRSIVVSACCVQPGAPTISSPICAGATSISGTSAEADGTAINVSKGNTLLGTATVSNGAWTLSVSGLVAGDVITANAETTAGCVSVSSSSVTVSPDANAGTVSGTTPLCIGGTATFTSNGDAGGSWSSSDATVASVDPTTGLVTALKAGTTNIIYTVSSGCNAPKT